MFKDKTLQTAKLLNIPDEDILLSEDAVKRFVLEWDPDFTKLTATEKAKVDKADEEMKSGIYATEEEVWRE